jgi:teichuronic acid biosynthesis glycosyltransferase TuaC
VRILTFSTLFPNSQMPQHGIFVAERLWHLVQSGGIDATVLAPVPWFPFASERFGRWARYARVEREADIRGIHTYYPRYAVIPKVGMSAAPWLLAASARRAIERLFGRLEEFDLIDAHYFYPDGVAAALLGRWFGKPVVITGRGTDLNLIPEHALPRRQIQWAARTVAGMITVSDALKGRLIDLGVPANRVTTLRNGVDLDRFRPLARDSIRSRLGLSGRVLLSVGNLIELKGHHIAIASLPALPDVTLIVAGTGPEESNLRALARRLEVSDRVSFTGLLDQAKLAEYYNAADCLVLCSSREGMANVLLESLACGTPVVTTPIRGTNEVVADSRAGLLMAERSPEALAEAVARIWESYPAREAVREYAQGFDWALTTRGQRELFADIVAQGTA